MCQGVIVSIVKFRTKTGKRKQMVLSSIGSHSGMLSANSKRLVRAGCDINTAGCAVVSAESDFAGRKYGRYTLAGGDPTKRDLAILTREFKRCAGSARSLIAYVRRVGVIDDALLDLLSESAWAEYKKVAKSAWAEYKKVTESAWAEYNKVAESAWAEYNKVTESAWARLFSKPKNRRF